MNLDKRRMRRDLIVFGITATAAWTFVFLGVYFFVLILWALI